MLYSPLHTALSKDLRVTEWSFQSLEGNTSRSDYCTEPPHWTGSSLWVVTEFDIGLKQLKLDSIHLQRELRAASQPAELDNLMPANILTIVRFFSVQHLSQTIISNELHLYGPALYLVSSCSMSDINALDYFYSFLSISTCLTLWVMLLLLDQVQTQI